MPGVVEAVATVAAVSVAYVAVRVLEPLINRRWKRIEQRLVDIDSAVNLRPNSDPKLYDVVTDAKNAAEKAVEMAGEAASKVIDAKTALSNEFRDHRRLVFDKMDRQAVDTSTRLRSVEERVSGLDDRVSRVDDRVAGMERQVARVEGSNAETQRAQETMLRILREKGIEPL